MTEKIQLKIVDRRDFVVGAAAAAALTMTADRAMAQMSTMDAIKKATGGGEATEGKVSLDLPEIAENGNTVPFTVSVDSPMTGSDYVKTLSVFATGNPNPDVATFHFSPQSGKASATSRMRLGKTQDIVAVAVLSNGKNYVGTRTVKVTIGGCGG